MTAFDFFDEDALSLNPEEELFFNSTQLHKPIDAYAPKTTRPRAHAHLQADSVAMQETRAQGRSRKSVHHNTDTAYAEEQGAMSGGMPFRTGFMEGRGQGAELASTGGMFFSPMPMMYNRLEEPIVLVGLDTIAYAVGAGPRTIKRWMQEEEFPAVRCSDGVYRADPRRVRRWFYKYLS